MRCRKPGSTVRRRPSFSASRSGNCVTGCSASASAMKIDPDGLLPQARYIASPNCDERPPGAAITLLILHSISLPPGQYGGDAIERLFTNRLDPAAHPYFRDIATLKLSSHFLVRRDGELLRALRGSLPLSDVAAHSDVAPDRKTDPGAHFDWARLLADLAR